MTHLALVSSVNSSECPLNNSPATLRKVSPQAVHECSNVHVPVAVDVEVIDDLVDVVGAAVQLVSEQPLCEIRFGNDERLQVIEGVADAENRLAAAATELVPEMNDVLEHAGLVLGVRAKHVLRHTGLELGNWGGALVRVRVGGGGGTAHTPPRNLVNRGGGREREAGSEARTAATYEAKLREMALAAYLGFNDDLLCCLVAETDARRLSEKLKTRRRRIRACMQSARSNGPQ